MAPMGRITGRPAMPFALHIAKSIDGSSGLLSVPARNGWLTATNGYCDDSAVHTALLLPCRRTINSPSATVAANHRKGKQRHDPARYWQLRGQAQRLVA